MLAGVGDRRWRHARASSRIRPGIRIGSKSRSGGRSVSAGFRCDQVVHCCRRRRSATSVRRPARPHARPSRGHAAPIRGRPARRGAAGHQQAGMPVSDKSMPSAAKASAAPPAMADASRASACSIPLVAKAAAMRTDSPLPGGINLCVPEHPAMQTPQRRAGPHCGCTTAMRRDGAIAGRETALGLEALAELGACRSPSSFGTSPPVRKTPSQAPSVSTRSPAMAPNTAQKISTARWQSRSPRAAPAVTSCGRNPARRLPGDIAQRAMDVDQAAAADQSLVRNASEVRRQALQDGGFFRRGRREKLTCPPSVSSAHGCTVAHDQRAHAKARCPGRAPHRCARPGGRRPRQAADGHQVVVGKQATAIACAAKSLTRRRWSRPSACGCRCARSARDDW